MHIYFKIGKIGQLAKIMLKLRMHLAVFEADSLILFIFIFFCFCFFLKNAIKNPSFDSIEFLINSDCVQ